ncbi:MAG: alanine--tRNA ligase [Deltaproteobacteria bacterium]|nr:alanine--tRNA ligase [Deltaproteobacteria bacterium]
MKGAEVRKSFLDFFASKNHLIVPSAPIVPNGDPTLMFTNAGMVQFKDVFLGLAEPPAPRVADSQKCLRISGKHNDLEDVGRDTYHHTLFEMLGNWSFGDYYKPEAIEWAWELLTGVWGLPKDKLYATVYRTDDEAEALWKKITDIGPERVRRFDEKDNFWEMGDTGPCGPCSEIHIDRGPGACDMRHIPGHVCDVNVGCARFMELWNLVFIQYSRDESGRLHELPAKHVDTGMGLERVASVLERVETNYDGSLLRALIAAAEGLSGGRYGADADKDISYRVLADHSRAISFMICDGIEPGNEGRGYVLRRLLRRAARHGKNLGLGDAFLYRICDAVVATMGDAYAELGSQRDKLLSVVRDEEERFAVTLDRGLVHLESEVARFSGTGTTGEAIAAGAIGTGAAAGKPGDPAPAGAKLPGEVAFRLYDTYGFPLDMTEDILRSRGMTVDREGFEAALEEQRERARGAQSARGGQRDYTLLVAAARGRGARFAGPFATTARSQVTALCSGGQLLDALSEGQEGELATALTPFYGESGGQVGDSGVIEAADGSRALVLDTQKPAPDVIVHLVRVERGRITVGQEVELCIDAERRQAIRLNHSATHLLHAALRHHLGTGVHQQGSAVDAARLRFDFNNAGPVADETLADVETEVNGAIRANLEVSVTEMPYDDAIAAGAMAFFGDKYGDVVRVVKMGDYSIELCGGTHVARTGDIGLLRVTSESGVAAGVRRMEATTGSAALALVRRRDDILREIALLLRTREEDAVGRIEKLLSEQRELEKKLTRAAQGQSRDLVSELGASARPLRSGKAIVARVEGVETKALRALSDRLRENLGSGVVVLAAQDDGAVSVLVAVTPDQTGVYSANDVIRQLVPLIDGRGGGKADFAQAGGKNPAGIAALLEKANEILC